MGKLAVNRRFLACDAALPSSLEFGCGDRLVVVRERAKSQSTINEARRLVERSRILCATAADLTREANAIRISIKKSLEHKRRVLRPN
jgi:hypothetical protein